MRVVLAALGLALAAVGVAAPATAQGDQPSSAAQDGLNHAAVVIDTGDGVVRKLCLAFPEAELSGIEALRRVDTRPNRFETFSGKGSGVCMLCGVGCESGDCFCDASKFWAYHRAGPGEDRYKVSSLGASSTVVRNGDVEAWKWGSGGAPAKTSVSEVCGVPEPPSRTASATTSTTATGSAPTTEVPQSPGPTTPTPSSTPPPTATPATPRPSATGTPTTTPRRPAAQVPIPGEVTEAPHEPGVEGAAAAPSGAEVKRSLGAEDGAATAPTERQRNDTSGGQLASLGAFTALLAGLLVWRSRIRRAKVRRVRPVR